MPARSEPQLFVPDSHEPLVETGWDAEHVRATIRSIAADAERAFSEDGLWPPHPLDEEDGEPPLDRPACLYLGAAGVIWALDEIARRGVVELTRDWTGVAAGLPERYLTAPDFPEDGVMPSLWLGEAGILLVAHRLAPSRGFAEALLTVVRSNASHPALELVWGSPGTMLAAQVMLERTGAPEWADAWHASADRLWAAWTGETWCQDIGGTPAHLLGAAHGLAGNAFVLSRGSLLAGERRAVLERRTTDLLARHALRADGCVQWTPALEPPRPDELIRTQFCHGAPGIVVALADVAPDDDELTALLVAGGELTWRAGPLRKGAGLCHGTAGNGYAFLKLFARTGGEEWLERARAFAMHAITQVERVSAMYGRGRYSLWTGDPGTALFLQSCIAATAEFPTLDTF